MVFIRFHHRQIQDSSQEGGDAKFSIHSMNANTKTDFRLCVSFPSIVSVADTGFTSRAIILGSFCPKTTWKSRKIGPGH